MPHGMGNIQGGIAMLPIYHPYGIGFGKFKDYAFIFQGLAMHTFVSRNYVLQANAVGMLYR
jgi:transketolase